ncbi:MAG TPA: hypothetical protein VJ824_15755 [Bacillota bacterium]|nr:hypothetical protein [Bacillota bacterium]
MHRLGISILGGFVLIYLESLLVMKFNGYSSLHFATMSKFLTVWSINFFLLYSFFMTIGRKFTPSED